MNRDVEWNRNLIPELTRITNINHARDIQEHHFKEIVSFSHIEGSITNIVVDYIKSAFGNDFIKTTWSTSEELFSQRGHKFKEVLSKPRPIMTIDPRFDPSDDSEFMPQSDFDMWVANNPNDDIWMSSRQSGPIIIGENFDLLSKPRRMKMDFNINFIFDSDIQRIQAQQYIRMAIRHRNVIILHKYIENNIPDNFMDAIYRINGFESKDSEEFLCFLNDRSMTPITRRLRTGSGTMEFFSMQHTPIQMKFNDLPQANGPVKRGNIVVSSSFTESVTVEFVVDCMYVLKTKVNIGEPIRNILATHPSCEHEVMKPMGPPPTEDVTFPVKVSITERFEDGHVKLVTIVAQPDKNGTDTINLRHLLNGEIYNLMKYRRDNKKPIDFLRVSVIETPENVLGPDKYTFDPETMDLTINDMDIYKSYHITIYLNKQMIHKEEMINFETDKFGRI